ncbi:HTH_48 domain-containing protein [Trichonephila clavipes]|nr:HTH_48 domain-containing protein [Trichonephila clavipes]
MEVTRVEQHAYIKIAVLRGRNAIECHNELVEALGNNALPYRTVARWVGKFQQGRVSTNDDQRGVANAETDGIQRFSHRCGDRSRTTLKVFRHSCTEVFGDGPRNVEPWSNDRTTPELEPLFLTSTPHQWEDI